MTDRPLNSDDDALENLADFLWPDDEPVTTTSERLKAAGVDVDGTVNAVKQQVAAMVERNRLAKLRQARQEMEAAKARLRPIEGRKSRQEMLNELKAHKKMVARKMDLTLDDLPDDQLASLYEDLKQAEQLDG